MWTFNNVLHFSFVNRKNYIFLTSAFKFSFTDRQHSIEYSSLHIETFQKKGREAGPKPYFGRESQSLVITIIKCNSVV